MEYGLNQGKRTEKIFISTKGCSCSKAIQPKRLVVAFLVYKCEHYLHVVYKTAVKNVNVFHIKKTSVVDNSTLVLIL